MMAERARPTPPSAASDHAAAGAPGSLRRARAMDIAWPRASLAPPGAPGYQVWAAPIVLAVIAVGDLGYLALARPHRRIVN